jgi:glycosyltransferase involved in cell wall biosynthesis
LILHIAGHPKLNLLRKTILKFASKKIFKVICPSNELKKILIKNDIFEDEKIIVIEDSHIEVKKIKYLKKVHLEDNFFQDSKILIAIGRMTKQKNYSFLIKNFKKLSITHADIKLLIIGDGEEKEFLKNLIKINDIANKVKLINYDSNIYRYLNKSNFYISTSIWEGSSLAMIDAAFIGIPILCSDCPSGRKEFIGNNERGFLYKQGDDEDFIKKFSIMYAKKTHDIKNILLSAKKETKKFSIFKNFLSYKTLLK